MDSIRAATRQRSIGTPATLRPVTRKEKLTLIATILGSTIVFLDSTVVNVALPTIQEDLDTGLAGQQWVVEAYMLSLVSLLLVGGSLGDLYGRRRLFVIGLCGFAVTSVLCAIAPSDEALVAARALQGIAGALLVPGSLAILAATFEGEARGRAVGLWTAWAGISTLIGPAGGGLLVELSWRWIFWINLPLIAVTIWLALRTIDESSDPEAVHGIDGVGIGLSALGLAGPVFALIEQPTYGFSDPIVWVPLVGGIACFGAFIWWQTRARAPILPLELFRSHNFATVNMATLAVYAALGGAFFFITLFLQQVAGYSAFQAGAATTPVTVLMFLLSGRFGALASRIGPRLPMGIGPLIGAVGLALLTRLSADPNYLTDVLPSLRAVRPRPLDDRRAADHDGPRRRRGAPRRRRLRRQQRGREGRPGTGDRRPRRRGLGPVQRRSRRPHRGAADRDRGAGGDRRRQGAAAVRRRHLGRARGRGAVARSGDHLVVGVGVPSGHVARRGADGARRRDRPARRPQPGPRRPRRRALSRARIGGDRGRVRPRPGAGSRTQAQPRAGLRLDSPRVRIFSGIQPTGRKHLGNYIGAISRYVEGQERAEREGGESIFCIVDLHAISVAYDPAELRERLHDTTAILLAAGLDPERCTLFRQSDVREHTELTWLLSAVTAHGDLNRMTQFKDKSAKQRELVSAALFLYPVLQAADVLAYKADEVPVGDDQRQHIELMREIARRFNERFAPDRPILVEPEHRIPEVGGRVMDLQEPTAKMSTTGGTEQGTVLVLDDEKTLRKKVMSAVTDSGSEVRAAADKPGISNLIEILAVVRGIEPAAVEAEFAGSGYGDFKRAVADAVVEYLAPVRERYVDLRADEAGLERVLEAGAEKARAVSGPTVAEVRDAMGIGPGLNLGSS